MPCVEDLVQIASRGAAEHAGPSARPQSLESDDQTYTFVWVLRAYGQVGDRRPTGGFRSPFRACQRQLVTASTRGMRHRNTADGGRARGDFPRNMLEIMTQAAAWALW